MLTPGSPDAQSVDDEGMGTQAVWSNSGLSRENQYIKTFIHNTIRYDSIGPVLIGKGLCNQLYQIICQSCQAQKFSYFLSSSTLLVLTHVKVPPTPSIDRARRTPDHSDLVGLRLVWLGKVGSVWGDPFHTLTRILSLRLLDIA